MNTDTHALLSQLIENLTADVMDRVIDALAERVTVNTPDDVQMVSINQAAEMWGCSRRLIERLIERGELRIVRIGEGRGDPRIPLSELRSWKLRHERIDNPLPAPRRLRRPA